VDKFDRIYQLHRILAARRTPIPFEDLREQLGCSRASAYRLIHVLENFLRTPVERDAETGGFRYPRDGRTFQLPGLWFTAQELQALVVFDRLLKSLDPGLPGEHLAPLGGRLGGMGMMGLCGFAVALFETGAVQDDRGNADFGGLVSIGHR